jgi:hypothetical protein
MPEKSAALCKAQPAQKKTVTRKELGMHLAALGVIYPPRASMSKAELTLRYRIFFDDLAGLSESEMARACERYRRDPKNLFFPTPGQLLKLAKL